MVNGLLEDWEDYCELNWLNDNDSLWSPEKRIKRFLDMLGYILLTGDSSETGTQIVSLYMDQAHREREVPMSAVPDYVTENTYGSEFGPIKPLVKAETDGFLSRFPDKETRSQKAASGSKRQTPRYDRLQRWKKDEGVERTERAVLDTEGNFFYRGRKYQVNLDAVPALQGRKLKNGDVLYEYDYLIIGETGDGTLKFCDPTLKGIDPVHIRVREEAKRP